MLSRLQRSDRAVVAAVFASGIVLGALVSRLASRSGARALPAPRSPPPSPPAERESEPEREAAPALAGLDLVRDWGSFEGHAATMAKFIVDYYTKSCAELPVRSQVSPGYLAPLLPGAPPDLPESLDAILEDVKRHIVPGITHWQHPSFFAFFPANSSYPGILADMLSDMFNVIAFSWVASPAATELETIVLDWLAELCGLPECFLSKGKGGGVIQGSASEAVVVALVAARCREIKRSDAVEDEAYAHAARCVVYASDQAHSSTQKACNILGLRFHKIASDPATCRLPPAALEAAIDEDVRRGFVPLACVATVGTTSSGAVDDLPAVGAVCERHRMWLHVDAAWAGSAAICPEFAGMFTGLELADSVDFNVHKWMLTNFDCSTMWVKDRSTLIDALGLTPVYLRTKEHDEGLVSDYRDWQVPLGRRFRALKIWFVLRMFGVEAIREHIRSNVAQAQRFEALVLADSRFELTAETYLGLVCFRLLGAPGQDLESVNELNAAMLERINASGETYLVNTKLHGVYTLRFAVGNPLTKNEHVDAAWAVIQREAAAVVA